MQYRAVKLLLNHPLEKRALRRPEQFGMEQQNDQEENPTPSAAGKRLQEDRYDPECLFRRSADPQVWQAFGNGPAQLAFF